MRRARPAEERRRAGLLSERKIPAGSSARWYFRGIGPADADTTPRGERFAALALATSIVVGAQALWLLVPVTTLWLLSRLLDSTLGLFFASFVTIPAAVVAFACLLASANARYLRLTGRRDGQGPLEAIIPATVVMAMIGLVVWLVFFAGHLPSGQEQLVP